MGVVPKMLVGADDECCPAMIRVLGEELQEADAARSTVIMIVMMIKTIVVIVMTAIMVL